jgi:hypothetical protein
VKGSQKLALQLKRSSVTIRRLPWHFRATATRDDNLELEVEIGIQPFDPGFGPLKHLGIERIRPRIPIAERSHLPLHQ